MAGLKKSLEEKREWHDDIYREMVKERSTVKNRLDRMYGDKLDGKVSDAFYGQKQKEYTARLDELEIRIARHDRADISYYDFGLKILELAKKAKFLYEMATPQEKQELLRFLLSNSTLKDGEADLSLKQPFLAISKHAPLGERVLWGGLRESNPY